MMHEFLQAAALALVAVILTLVLQKQNPQMGLLVALGGCCLICLAAVRFLEPVIGLLEQIQRLADLDPDLLAVVLKAAGIGLLTELCSLICTDAGQNALGKALQTLSAAAILWLSLPLIRELLSLLEEVLGQL